MDNQKELFQAIGQSQEEIDKQLKEVATKMVLSTWSDLYERFGADLKQVEDKKKVFEALYHRALGMVTLEDGRKLLEDKSMNQNRPYLHLDDEELAQKLSAAEFLIKAKFSSLGKKNDTDFDLLKERNNLIEEIIFRYTR